jgi:hypothetical protein
MWSDLALEQDRNSVRHPGLIAFRPGRCTRPHAGSHHL